MADDVQRLMEDMLPELEDLAQRELFSQAVVDAFTSALPLNLMQSIVSPCQILQAEIKSIIKKRRDFEYTLKRRKLFRFYTVMFAGVYVGGDAVHITWNMIQGRLSTLHTIRDSS